MTTTYTLSDLKPLTTNQYDECRERALKRVQSRIGDRPSRQHFERELGRLWTALDSLALVVFICALVVSSAHIMIHMGKVADASFAISGAGAYMSQSLYVAIHQWALIPLAEGSLILFTVMFSLTGKSWRRWLYLLLALAAVTFVLVANVQSGIGALESILAPAFTIGIGLKLEHLIVQGMKRRRDVDERYLSALSIWEAANLDATKHPDYTPMMAQEIWAAVVKLKANQWATEAGAGFKRAAVGREMKRDTWAYDDVQPENALQVDEPAGKGSKPANQDVPFGSIAPIQAVPDFTAMTGRVNGHGG
jgi:hypothetical protein